MATGGDATGGGGVYATDCKLTVGSVGDHSEVFLVKQQQQQHTHHHHHVPESVECKQLQNLIANTKQHIATHCPHGYVETKALRELKGELEKQGACLVLGLPGHGKTALALQAMGSLAASHNLKPVYLKKPEQWEWIPGGETESQKSEPSFEEDIYSRLGHDELSETEKFSPKVAMTDPPLPLPHSDGPDQHKHESQRYIVLLDDAFGQGHYDDAKKTAWEEVFDLMLAKVRAKQIKLIIVSRAHIYETCKKSLSAHPLFHHARKIDLSQVDYWTRKDKEAILYNFLRGKTVHLNKPMQEFMDASENCHQIGFPQMCRFFADEKQAQLQGPEFFRKPLQFLQSQFEILAETDIESYLVLLLACLKGGSISNEDLRSDNERFQTQIQRFCNQFGIRESKTVRDVQIKLQSLCGVYLTKDAEGNFRFTHQSISDSLVVAMCSHNLKQALAVCSIQQLCEYIQTAPSTTDCLGLTFTVPKSQWPLLAERLIKAMTSEELPQALHHQCLQNPEFVTRLAAEHLSSSHLSRMLEMECFCAIDIPGLQEMTYVYERSKTKAITKGILAASLLKSAPDLFRHILQTKGLKKLSKSKFRDHLREALLAACYVGNEEFVTSLLKEHADVTWDTLSVTCSSALDNDPILAKIWHKLRRKKMTLDLYQDLLWMCCVKGKVNSLQYLLTEARPSDCQDVLDTVITEILKEIHPSNVTRVSSLNLKQLPGLLVMFKSAGATVDETVMNAWFAAGHLDPTVMKELLSGKNLRDYGISEKAVGRLFHESARWNSVECMDLLIDSLGTSAINVINNENRTPLHIAALYQHVDVIDVLLKHNAKTDLLDCKKRIPLHLYALTSQITMSHSSEEDEQQTTERQRVEELLVKNTENINQDEERGRTPLHFAVTSMNATLAETLLKHKANPDLQDELGKTCLHLAVEHDNHILVQTLVKHKAKLDLQDYLGHTPVHTATSCVAVTCLKILRKRILDENLLELLDRDDRTPLHLYALSSGPHQYFRDTCRVQTVERLEVEEMLVKNTKDVNQRDKYRCTPLHQASAKNKLTLVKTLLRYKAKVDLQDAYEQTPIHTAARYGSIESLQVLIAVANHTQDKNSLDLPDKDRRTPLHLYALCPQRSDGPDTRENAQQTDERRRLESLLVKNTTNIDQQDKDKRTPLHLAVCHSKLSLLEVFLEHKANPDLQDSRKQTSLHLAVSQSTLSLLEVLLKHKANPDLQDSRKETCLHLAARTQKTFAMQMLLQHKANTDIENWNGDTALHVAAYRGHLIIVEKLLENKAHINLQNCKGKAALHLAVESRQSPVIEKLLEHKADINLQDSMQNSPLHLAVVQNNLTVVEILLKHKARTDVQDAHEQTPIHTAIRCTSVKCLQALMAAVANQTSDNNPLDLPDKDRRTPLHLYALWPQRSDGPDARENAQQTDERRRLETLLVKNTTNIDQQDKDECTSLHLTVCHSKLSLMEVLLEHRANPDLQSSRKETCLHLAVKNGNTSATRLLLKHKADTDLQDCEGKTALHVAACNGHLILVEKLLENKAHINLQNCKGKAALHLAVESRQSPVIEKLLEHKADINLQDSMQNSPLHLAVVQNNLTVVEMLLKHKARTDVQDAHEQTPIHTAIRRKSVKCLQALMAAVANQTSDNNPLDLPDKDRRTPLHIYALWPQRSDGPFTRENAQQTDEKRRLETLLVKNTTNIDQQDKDECTSLHLTVCHSKLSLMEVLLEHRANPDLQNSRKETCLHLAVEYGNTSATRLLLKHKANTDLQDSKGKTALHLAADRGHVILVEKLLENKAHINLQNCKGKAALHLAVESRQSPVIEKLLEHKADTNLQDSMRNSPLHLAVVQNNLTVVEILLKHKARTDVQDAHEQTPIHTAIRCTSVKCLQALMAAVANQTSDNNPLDLPDKDRRTPLHLYALWPQRSDSPDTRENAQQTDERRRLETLLVKNTTNIDQQDKDECTSLHLTVCHSKLSLMKVLLEHKANPDLQNSRKETCLHLAVKNGNTSATRLLLKHKADTDLQDCEGKSALHVAVNSRESRVVEKLLEHKADINVQDFLGKSPLHLAVVYDDLVDLTVLLKHKARTDLQDADGQTAIHTAIRCGSMKCLRALLAVIADHTQENNPLDLLDKDRRTSLHLYALCPQGPDGPDTRKNAQQTDEKLRLETLLVENTTNIDQQDKDERTPLHLAALRGKQSLMKVLLEHKANPDLQNSRKQTSLHLAVGNGNTSAVEILLEYKADTNVQDSNSNTALHVATDMRYDIIVEKLLEHKAHVNLQDCKGKSALHLAVEWTNLPVVENLLEHKADINLQDFLGKSPLHLAVVYDDLVDLAVVEMLLKHKARTDLQDADGQTAIHTAVRCGSMKCLRALLAVIADHTQENNPLDLPDKDRRTSLHLYALCLSQPDGPDNRENAQQTDEERRLETLLVKNTTNIDQQDKDERTPLHLAVCHSKLSLMKVLLKHKANPDIQDSRKQTSLHLAVENGNTPAKEIPLECKADSNIQDFEEKSALHVAVNGNKLSLVEVLLQHKANPDLQDSMGRTPLHLAVVHDDLAQVEVLLEHKARTDIQDTSGQTPIHIAAQRGFVSCLHSLTAAVAQTTLKESPLNMLDGNGCTPLLLYAVSPRMLGETSTRDKQQTAKTLQVEELLVKNTADVNQKDKDGRASLHLAAWRGKASLVKLLLKQANPDVQDPKGRVPLHFAAVGDAVDDRHLTLHVMTVATCEQNNAHCRLKAETLLVEKTTDVNIQDDDGRTALHMAAGQGSLTLVVSLLARGARTDLADKEGRLPLHCMAARTLESLKDQERADEAMTELMERTLDINAQDSSRCTALQLTVDQENWSLVKLLLKHGAVPHLLDEKSLSLLKCQSFATTELLHKDRRRGLVMEDVGSSVC